MAKSPSTSSLDENEKEKEFGLVDPQAAAENPTEYEPIRSEPQEKIVETGDSHGSKGRLARLQSSTSAYSETSDAETDTTRSIRKKKPFYKRLNFLKRNPPPVPKQRVVCPEYTAGLFSRLSWQWMQPLMAVGYKRPLENNDLWMVNPDRSADVLAERLEAAFKRRREQGADRPLLGAMFDTFKWEFIIGGLCQLTASVIQAVAPFVLRYLITFAARAYVAENVGGPAPHIGEGIGLVIGITAMQFFQSLATNHFMYRGMMIGGEARGVLIALIFNKAMKLSGRAKAGGAAILDAPPADIKPGSEAEVKWYKKMLKKKDPKKAPKSAAGVAGDGEGWGNGRIVNLMSTDTYRVDQASGFFHMIWTAPIGILITTALLLVNLKYSALPGLGLILIAMPLLGRAVKTLFRRRVVINKVTDQRVSLTQEILQGVRFVKYFGWETSFLERIQAIRKREIHGIQILLTIRNAVLSVGMSMPIFASMISFITYSQVNADLNPAPIFSSLALFNSMRIPLNFLPLVIGQVIDANASIDRIQEFLLAEEAEESGKWDYDSKDAVVLKGADFTWERHPTQDPEDGPPGKKADAKKDKKEKRASVKPPQSSGDTTPSDTTVVEEEKPFEIKGLNLTFGRNELVAIIGGVGSGKSSLLAALAGDMRKTSGEVIFGASRAFCPQYAWIQNATVRENIIFGKEFNKRWYDQVVDACALRPDLDMLPHNDATEIGERGITVSGGQKQRMNIARAIYFNADIVLMDDPLSAVDAHVGRHIMDNAICGLLKDKCRILATHQLHVLSRCDRIIWVDQGQVKAVDTFDNLMAHNADFVQEERATKSVSWEVWIEYIKAGGGIWVGPLIFILLVLSQGANIVTSLWLSYWTSDKFGYSKGAYIGAYAAFGLSQAIFMFLFSFSVSIFGTRAGKVMLHRAITRVLRAPMSFFDTTPLGRITNRFSKDIDVMDNTITDSIRMYFLTLAMIISVFILIISYYYFYAIALGPLFLLFMFSAAFYRSSAREVKRHEAVLRSTVFSRFGEAVMGTATIRAYGLQDQFSKTVRAAVDDMNSAYYLTFANQRWLSVRLDLVGILLVFTTGILVVTSRFSVNPSIAGLVLSYILTIVQMIQFTVRQLAEVENNMNSTERIHHYGTQLEEEAPLHMGEVRPTWPEHGEIVFDKVEMRYRAGLPLVLKGLSMHVRAGERIGVVGRTGAGKSSIMSALFRLQELSGGSIVIDGVDIGKIGLHDLRSKLAIIPQDPTLFKGTIRSNLDPFHEHSDLELWSALRQADLVSNEQEMEDHTSRIHLDSIVEEEGLNFSLGQRQLMALARALVRGSQIIVCDEATSSVDFETDAKIQKTIVQGFKGKTLLCIAHRLKTIINYDRICVMDAGLIAELDSPLKLYDQGGIFKGMCDRSGIKREEIAGAN
ncbi:MdlB ABC-type multidrug transport system ATPase and permease component [Pyrenophora tritici-repentis]|uniref:MdlB, ABC-type multidrug transport system, ATPase and permease component n=1 Tax=Pyrenophora tritici-repentis TaxID=45151 RepID=A0A2W1DIC7_9PLEO|nr:MdlB, ABC-type multidrug transport system, ATPase and permease component [Pyrenophora tritici-repentis]KAI0589942.1 ATPase [Pyrenophora tritici-repentis]KAI1550430.1 MdlB ABC-type multidrug transport system ATPase and permease component [Pyrenophora tritici-repentis]KAI1553477.1 MdlB ABC-type multidrug transport system ATPase and permease component [Pyrenophora tritici-repentis]KAI1558704.1 MdlB ABC-type multidrug transport system ATPase and permease component [Pyrenophora tritici-repentis]